MSTRTRRTWPAFDFEVEREDAAAGLDRQLLLGGDAVVVDVLGDAADAVAAHLAFGAVGVEHPHPGIGPLGGHDQDQAVAADAEVAVADGARQRARGRAAAPGRRC